MKKRWQSWLAVCLLLMLSFAACASSPVSPLASDRRFPSADFSMSMASAVSSPSETTKAPAATPAESTQAVTTTPVITETPTPSFTPTASPTASSTPAVETSDIPRFTTLTDAKDYLRESAAQCPETISIYLDDLSTLMQDPDWTTRVRELLMEYAFLYTTDESTGLLTMHPSYYAGTRILHAVETGDFSVLTAEELSAYDIAMAVVNEAKASSSSALQLEKALHDYLCQTVTYVGLEDITLPEDNTPHRILTAVGALVYGQANCQGYSDAFFLLGELAGFQVRRQDGWDNGEAHRWNTIERAGQWYIVDVTHDANLGNAGSRPYSYQWFNVGLDLCGARSWNPVSETAPVAAATNPDLFYYSCDEVGFGTVFTDIREMAAYLYEARLNQGQSTFYTMLQGQELTWESLSNAISDYANTRPITCSWTIWATSGAENTYYLLDWTAWDG